VNIILKHLKGDGLKAQLLKGVTGTAGLMAINVLLLLVISMLLARALGPENFGIYTFILAIIALLSLPTKAGLSDLLLRETARNQLNQNWGLIRGLLKLANSFVFCYSVALAVAAGLFVWWLWGGTGNVKANSFLWSLWLLPLIAFEGARTGTLRGLRWVVSSLLPEQLIRPLLLVVLSGAALLLEKEITPITAIQYNLVAAVAAFAAGAFLLFKALPKDVRQAKAEYAIKPWAASLMPLSLFAGLQMLDSQISILLLGVLAKPEDVGLFKVAVTGASLVAFGLIAVNMTLAPQIARLHSAGEMEKLQRMVTLSTRVVVTLSFPVAFAFIFWGEELISLVFGVEYVGAAMALSILCVGQMVNASTGSVALILNMTGNDRKTLPAVCAALLVNSLFSILLIPIFGLTGAAIGYATSMVIWNSILFFVTKRVTGINTFFLGAVRLHRDW
jgi:O-antigen/teichoic acid export membrane protein